MRLFDCPSFASAVGSVAPAVPAGARGHAAAGEGPVSADRLSCRHGAARHHLDHQSAAAQLRAAAGALRACGDRRARGLDRRRCSAAASRSAAAMVATNDSTTLQLRLDVPENAADGHAEPDRHAPRARATEVTPADRRHARQGSAGQAVDQAAAAVAARHLEVELRVSARHQERQRPQSRRRASRRRRRRTSRRASPSSTAARSCPRSRSRPASPRPSSSRSGRRARSAPTAIRSR